MLVGVFVILRQGSIMQIVAATFFCMIYQLVQVQVAPFTEKTDDAIASLCSFGTRAPSRLLASSAVAAAAAAVVALLPGRAGLPTLRSC